MNPNEALPGDTLSGANGELLEDIHEAAGMLCSQLRQGVPRKLIPDFETGNVRFHSASL